MFHNELLLSIPTSKSVPFRNFDTVNKMEIAPSSGFLHFAELANATKFDKGNMFATFYYISSSISFSKNVTVHL
jgi:hypothetical protein